ncbi:related to NAD(P)H-dependent oxidoreductase [Sporisorium reilianum SRZ2]|uniref:Related to NAD(P)H-dependent oxidoreductase n=1 Tax=Sporisorium reilianum (strain SRZ2) TaxID=999809 RepID=E6ZNS8_SPORE|nr:related to NAD(P)H-dependent oxidoreductase [Sporisorium reilianum SRZ2]
MTTPLSASTLFDLTGKVALVTGGGTGLGLTAALALASNGATVYISGRRKERLDEAVEVYGGSVGGGRLIAVQGDVSSKSDLAAIAATISAAHPALHILVNNAGIEGPMTKFPASTLPTLTAATLSADHLASESFEDWDRLFRINTSSIFFSTMTFLPLLHASHTPTWTSSVINITSISGIVKLSQSHYAYNASKAAANHLTQMLSHELRFRTNLGVRVNAIAPGLFSSEMTSGGKSEKGKTSSEDVKGHENPAGRVGSEDEYAQLVLLLAGNGFMTGQIVAVDGGFVTAVAANR